ncbi:Abortive infection protein AbiEi [Clostridium sp. 'deep sea']|uniref:type IV toxin-antitoxin system AbiEi family antitoxin domain-containing protein n=1 Tax=Clostridium sp. 'deep sea' TaxID=2779445 RepID=UPI0018969B75|nr:Abortive infection protein AbiEi [Clostridium sp. 'deep sea']QOR35547.1 Abortive infection protein AbiEi [Clostridium sp. 'deep sea']
MTDRFYIDSRKRSLGDIKEMFYGNHGYLQIKDLRAKGLKLTDIRFLQEQGVIMRVEQGLYKWIGVNKYSFISDVVNAVPNGVFCLVSALYFHGLVDKIPSICYIAIPNGLNGVSLPVYPKIQLISMKENHFQYGITTININNQKIRIYDIEKTLCDCLRYRSKIGLDVVKSAFVTYKNNFEVNEKKIWQYGTSMRMKLILNRYIPKFLL